MLVNNRHTGTQLPISESTNTSVRQGEAGQSANIEATVTTKGQELTQKETVDQQISKLGLDATLKPEIREALTLLMNRGYPITSETISAIKQFLNSPSGTTQDKLGTIQALIQRKLEVNPAHLSTIHQALQGSAVSKSIDGILKDKGISIGDHIENRPFESKTSSQQPVDNIIDILRKQLKGNPDILKSLIKTLEENHVNLPNSVKSELQKALQIIEAGNARIEKSPVDAAKLIQIGMKSIDSILSSLGKTPNLLNEQGPSELQKQFSFVLNDVQKEASFPKLLDSVKQLLTKLGESDINDTLEKALQLSDQGREMAARKELSQVLAQLEQKHPDLQQKQLNPLALSQAEEYYINEVIQSLNVDSRNIIVTEISKKLSQLAIDFKKMKQDVTKNLDQINRIFQENKPISPTQVKQLLESSIKQLDNAIMRGNFLLYTDMNTEKNLLKASSQLAEAKNLLLKGNLSEANQIVKEVKSVLEPMIFKPSDVRVKHFVSEQSLLLKEMHPTRQLAHQLQQAVQPFPEQEHTGRQMFETVRRLGLTYENEVAHSLVGTSKGEQELTSNLKSTLLRLIQMEEGHSRNTQPLEQALSNLTGQQLLNKQDSSGIQNLFMQLPILLNKQVEDVKIYINSQKKGEKIDWENCSLYFVLETKKLGDVGILVTSTNRNLSITLKNDREYFAEKVEKLTQVSIDRLKEVGYQVGSIQFKPFKEKEVEKASPETQKEMAALTNHSKKGYDFTI